MQEPGGCRSNYWLQTLVLPPEQDSQLGEILQRFHEEKILARPAWNPLHQAHSFVGCPRMNLDTAESLARRILNLPSSPSLTGSLR